MREERVSLVGQADREEIPVIYFILGSLVPIPGPKASNRSGFGLGTRLYPSERVVKVDGRESASMGSSPGGGGIRWGLLWMSAQIHSA